MTQRQSSKTVNVGCWVRIAGFEPEEEETYHIVDDPAAEPLESKIGESNPLAQALIGKQVGDKVPFHTPAGNVNLTIVELGRA